MITLVIGGSGSGKSEYGELILQAIQGVDAKYYIATMIAFGEEGKKRVERHRKLRQGKGFITIEQTVDIIESTQAMECQDKEVSSCAAILECVSNLVANEMFREEGKKSEKDLDRTLGNELMALANCFQDFVIISNNVFEDGILYDEGTRKYQECLARLNQYLASAADRVVEVVAGIPIEQHINR